MPAKGVQPVVSEYRILWEALKHYEERLEKLSSVSTDADQRLKYDEKLQDIEEILRSLKMAAMRDYDLKLG